MSRNTIDFSRHRTGRQAGISLIEVLIAMALGLLVSGAIGAVFVMSAKTFRTQDSTSRLQESARFAMSLISRDIRMAGFRGCLGGRNNTAILTPVVNTIAAPVSYNDNFAQGMIGYHASGSTWTPALDASISAASPAPLAGTDVITLRLASATGLALASTMASALVDIPLASNAGLSVGDTALIADCVASVAFKITAVNTDGSISHTAPNNATTNFGRAFGTDASVMPVRTVTYYVAPSSYAPTGTEKSLWQINNGTASEITDGVENMQILYGEDKNGDLVPENYVSADNVTNYDNVIAVRISLLMSTDDNTSSVSPTYTYNGVAQTATDRRIRRPYSTTISLRNRTD